MSKTVDFSVFENWINILSNLLREIKELGGTSGAFGSFNNQKVINQVAEILVTEFNEASLIRLITNIKLGWKDENINAKTFPALSEDGTTKNKEYKFFDCTGVVSLDDAVNKINHHGYHPATLRQLLIWGAEYWSNDEWIVALGQYAPWSNTVVPSLEFHGFDDPSERRLGVNAFAYYREVGAKLLGVREISK